MKKEWRSVEEMENDLKKLEESKKKKQEMTEEEKQLDFEISKQALDFLIPPREQRATMRAINKMKDIMQEKQPQLEKVKKQFKKDLEGVTPETAERIVKKYRQLYADIFS